MKKTIMIVAGVIAVGVVFFATQAKAVEISDERREAIITHCDAIKEDLINLQHRDARVRTYLGRHYETILNKFISPLNLRLENDGLVDNGLKNNQDNFTKTRMNFVIDYNEYQKALESLVGTDCKSEPTTFYEKLENVRLKRGIVSKDVLKLRALADEQLNLVDVLKGDL